MNSKSYFFVLLAVVVITVVTIVGVKMSSGDQAEMVKRGKYLVDLGGCNFCHTPKVMTSLGMELDRSRLLSGHPQNGTVSEYTTEAINEEGWVTKSNFHLTQWLGPWGVSFAANLTPDEVTGIGAWSEEVFIEIMRTGRHLGSGRRIQLPMPWDNFANLSDDDLQAIYAYLKSLKPIKNSVPAPISPEEAEISLVE
jgi:cytochrome c553